MPKQPATLVSALSERLRADPGRPLVTRYDDATGERVELSVATFDNWVCKLANLFAAEWELEPPDIVAVTMPQHWQSMVAMCAAWRVGLTVCLDPGTEAAARVVGPQWSGGETVGERVLACSLRPFAGRFTSELPPGWLDWALEVPPQPDVLLISRPAAPADLALLVEANPVTHAGLVQRGLASAEAIGLEPGGRLLTDLNPAGVHGIDAALLAPLATGSSVVLLANSAPSGREAVTRQERVTCEAWAIDGPR